VLRSGAQAATRDVAHHHADPLGGQHEDVVPIAAHASLVARDIARGELDATDPRQSIGQQAPLQRECGGPLDIREAGLCRQRDPVRGQLEQIAVLAREGARRQRADVQDADDGAGVQQWHTQQRPHAAVAQNRVEHVGVVDVVEHDRTLPGGDRACEPTPHRDAHSLRDFLFDPARRRCHQLVRTGVQQEDRGGVDVQDLAHAVQELDKQLFDVEMGERRIRERLDVLEPIARRLRHRLRYSHVGAERTREPTVTAQLLPND